MSEFYESLETIRHVQIKVLVNYESEGSGFESLRAHVSTLVGLGVSEIWINEVFDPESSARL